jgi:hypothetical protein
MIDASPTDGGGRWWRWGGRGRRLSARTRRISSSKSRTARALCFCLQHHRQELSLLADIVLFDHRHSQEVRLLEYMR